MPSNLQSDDSEIVNLTTLALAKLLGGERDTKTPCTLQVWQFGTNLLYLPVYLLLHDIQMCWDEMQNADRLKRDLIIEYQNFIKDEYACEAVKNQKHPWSRDQESILTLGLSELPSEFRAATDDLWFIEFPFIKRLPLWGLSLVNNPKINSLKKRPRGGLGMSGAQQSEDGYASGGEERRAPSSDESRTYEDAERRASMISKISKKREIRLEYWNVFGGKLSLLKPSDLVDPKLRLGISLYKAGTTAHSLFMDDFLRGLKTPVSFASEVTFANEFDDLFRGIVDVALTVQPWMAVRQGAKIGSDLEVVYVHQGKPKRFSSIYCRVPAQRSDKDLLKAVLDTLHLGVQAKIECIYELNEMQLDLYLAVINDVSLRANRKAEELLVPDAKTDIGGFGEDDMSCALDLISDSRVYYYRMSSESQRSNLEKASGMLRYCTDIQDYELNRGVGADPIATITRIVALIPSIYEHRNDSLTEVMDLGKTNKEYISSLITIASRHGVRVDANMTCQMFSDTWRCLTIGKLLPRLCEATIANAPLQAKLTADDWWRNDNGDYTFWFAHKKLIDALSHFDSQFIKEDEARRIVCVDCKAGVLRADDEGLAWIWITYNGTVTKDPVDITHPDLSWHFVRDRDAKMYLHGWFVSNSYRVNDHPEPWLLFDRQHAKVTRNDQVVQLAFAGNTETLSLAGANHGLLLTFRVMKKK